MLCDSTEYNLQNHLGRINDFEGLGSTSQNYIVGFFSHNQLVIGREESQILGWGKVHLFNRSMDNKAFKRPNSSVPISEKESNKWLEPSIETRDEVLAQADHCLFVKDREADIFEVKSLLPNERSDYLIRAKHDRVVFSDKNEKVKLKSDLKVRKIRKKVAVQINGESKKRSKRIAQCAIRYETYTIPRPLKIYDKTNYPETIKATAICINEIGDPPIGEEPLEWILWTSEQVKNNEDALELIDCYAKRWVIEEAHRLLKTKGFDIESSELESGRSIRKLLILGMEASIKVMQLKAAREGQSGHKTIEIFKDEEIKFLDLLNQKLQGKTEKLKNPHSKEKLGWASWIIARLGGWKGYQAQRPPGTIMFKRGLDKFYDQYEGYLIAKQI